MATYLKMYVKSERFYPRPDEEQTVKPEISSFHAYDEDVDGRESGGGGGVGGGARRCVRDGAPAHRPPTTHTGPQTHPGLPSNSMQPAVKSERLSPHDSTASRSRSATPSSSSYPGTPPAGERCSPYASLPAPLVAPLATLPAAPRNYSDIMRSLAARYNTHTNNDYFHRINGVSTEARCAGVGVEPGEAALGGLFSRLGRLQGGPPRLPAFPPMIDMNSTKTLMAISRVGRGGRARRRRRPGTSEHSPLDLSAGGDGASKRRCLADDDDNRLSEDRDCVCKETRARLQAWSVDEVCDFVTNIDNCAEYASNFREQRIDGAGLPLLTEDHLTGLLQMKLGPALKLKSVLAKKMEPCGRCQTSTLSSGTVLPRTNGATVKAESRSNTTSPS